MRTPNCALSSIRYHTRYPILIPKLLSIISYRKEKYWYHPPTFLVGHNDRLGVMNVIISPILCMYIRQPPPLYLAYYNCFVTNVDSLWEHALSSGGGAEHFVGETGQLHYRLFICSVLLKKTYPLSIFHIKKVDLPCLSNP